MRRTLAAERAAAKPPARKPRPGTPVAREAALREAAFPDPGLVSRHARRYSLIVHWSEAPGAVRVRVDALDAAGVRLLGARVDAIARQLKLGKLPPDPLQVELVMSSASGDQLTRGVSRAVRKT